MPVPRPVRAEPGRAASSAPPTPLLLGYLQMKLAALPGPRRPPCLPCSPYAPLRERVPRRAPLSACPQLKPRLWRDRVTGRRGKPICSARTGGAAGAPHLGLQPGREDRGPALLQLGAPAAPPAFHTLITLPPSWSGLPSSHLLASLIPIPPNVTLFSMQAGQISPFMPLQLF